MSEHVLELQENIRTLAEDVIDIISAESETDKKFITETIREYTGAIIHVMHEAEVLTLPKDDDEDATEMTVSSIIQDLWGEMDS